ncbi:hypothetical protein FSP39_003041 [Pinctada imbricata]|uniref:Uncharacterized protein n=1 Tax=Pinctada imbricata TaxID=66713 RepID=A0AA88Y8Y0_PINIB|nr:hypothetical protein FSP39_003041 [Pinctada imbricata]
MSQNQTEQTNRSFGETCQLFAQVFKKIWVQALSVWFVFFVTLTIFPSIWSQVERKDFPLVEDKNLWSAIFCFLSFNLFAFIGNIVSEWVKVPGPKYVWIPIALRGLFIPFFVMCRFALETRNFPVIIDNDYVYIVGGIVLAFTSGYFSSLTMMYGPKLVGPEVAGIAGMIMAFCLVMGITTGVNFSLAVASIVTTNTANVGNVTMS